MVSLASPPPSRPITPRHVLLAAGTQLVRIYNPTYLEPNGFNHNGPRSRFDHHHPANPPQHDVLRGTYYAAPDLSGCVVEVFGDTGIIDPGVCRVAVVELQRAVKLLDLSGHAAWDAGTVAAVAKDADRRFSQQWARYFYESAAQYGVIDGLHYENAHNSALAYVLFERAGSLRVRADMALSDARLAGELAAIANELNMFFV